jgi:ribonucrease Y
MQKTFGNKPQFDNPTQLPVVPADLVAKETELAKKEGALETKENLVEERLGILDSKLEQVEKTRKDLIEKLEKSAKMSQDEASKILLEQVDKELAVEISKKVKAAEDEIKLQADEKAKNILADAMIYGVTDYIAEFTTSRVDLANEEMKGRIIGKEGRNIRAFEQATGVDVIMDDEQPNSLILSSFDPIRREIARVSLQRLIADERIHPQRIEEVVEKTTQDIEKTIAQAGEELCFKAGVFGLPLEVVTMLGRFKYRYSYGQSLVQHSLELVQVGVEMAKAIGASENVVRLGCLLHDIGKVVYEGEEGTHVEKGVKFLKQFDIPKEVIDAVAQHHEDEPFTSVESILVAISDAISGGRPGARHENVQDYIKRLNDIERIATSYEGVEKAFAVQAGREVRVIVVPEKVADDELPKLVHDIGEQIQKEVMVPGAVKITAVREVRASESFLTSGS